jgi:acetylornithine deacetylase/succinyl-diaminopimelate desuccinylase-like protein
LIDSYPLVSKNIKPTSEDPMETYVNSTWKAQLTVTGMNGMPPAKGIATNMLRPETTLKLSMRLPPTKRAEESMHYLKKILLEHAPYDSVIEVRDMYYS